MSSTSKPFTFIDLFAGIGGFHLACTSLGGKCVFTSEWDKYAAKTYKENWGGEIHGDITQIKASDIPDHDLICAGIPCQAFSISGKRAGFADIRGTMFAEVVRIAEEKKPKAIFLENVKGLLSHDKGNTLKTIIQALENIGYDVVPPQIVNSSNFGVAQKRERVFLAAFRKDLGVTEFKYPVGTAPSATITSVLERQVDAKYYLSEKYWNFLGVHKARHANKGNGFGYQIIPPMGQANTLMVGGQGHEHNLLKDPMGFPLPKIPAEMNKDFIRKMTPREWARIQGFPDTFKIVVSDTQAYKQFGNSVAVPAVTAMVEKIVEKL